MKNQVRKQKFPKPMIIDKLNEYIYGTYIFRAGLELRIWDKIAKGWDTSKKIAERENWDQLGTQMLLDDLCCLKLLKRHKNRYQLTRESECYLLSDKPSYRGKYLMGEFHWEGDGLLADTIRTGKRPIYYNATVDKTVDLWIDMYGLELTDIDDCLKMARLLWKKLDIKAHAGMRVLDIACGPTPRTYSLALQNARVKVTLLDWEKILKTALNFARKLKIEEQVTTKKGDFWITNFGQNRFDVAFLGNITHFFSPEENIRLFKKTYNALVPGGVIAISAVRHEYLLPSDPELWYYAHSECGAVYNFDQYKSMLKRAGFVSVQDIPQLQIKAIKPLNRKLKG